MTATARAIATVTVQAVATAIAHVGVGASTQTVGPAAKPASICGSVTIDLLDVYVQGAHVKLLGYANPGLAGDAVTIDSALSSGQVAGAVVGRNGYFAAQAPLPPANQRMSDRARYTAHAGRHASPALKLSRRMYVYSVSAPHGGKVTITGRVVPPLGHPPAPIVVTRRNSCAQRTYATVKATVHLAADGSFTVVAPAPPSSAPGATYVLRTRVRPDAASTRLFATNTLPRVVGE